MTLNHELEQRRDVPVPIADRAGASEWLERDVIITGERVSTAQANFDENGRPNFALADFVAPEGSGLADYMGAFVVTAGAASGSLSRKPLNSSPISFSRVSACAVTRYLPLILPFR